jgi:hypothetical protein
LWSRQARLRGHRRVYTDNHEFISVAEKASSELSDWRTAESLRQIFGILVSEL